MFSNFHNMQPGQVNYLENNELYRVPGGWVMKTTEQPTNNGSYSPDQVQTYAAPSVALCFIPFSDEFSPEREARIAREIEEAAKKQEESELERNVSVLAGADY